MDSDRVKAMKWYLLTLPVPLVSGGVNFFSGKPEKLREGPRRLRGNIPNGWENFLYTYGMLYFLQI